MKYLRPLLLLTLISLTSLALLSCGNDRNTALEQIKTLDNVGFLGTFHGIIEQNGTVLTTMPFLSNLKFIPGNQVSLDEHYLATGNDAATQAQVEYIFTNPNYPGKTITFSTNYGHYELHFPVITHDQVLYQSDRPITGTVTETASGRVYKLEDTTVQVYYWQ